METQTRLSRHNKFISAENIIGIFSISSDDSFTCSVLSQTHTHTHTHCSNFHAEKQVLSFYLWRDEVCNYNNWFMKNG